VPESTLTDLVTRLERERLEADRRYNEALTALDAALPGAVTLPAAPAAPDETRLPEINPAVDIRPAVADGGGFLSRRLRAAVRAIVGPSLEQQQRFNAAVVEHLNRNIAAERDARTAAAALIDATRRHLDALSAFHSRLIQYLQQVTPFVETKDRAIGGTELRDQIGLANERTLALKREIERLATAGGAAPGAGTTVAAMASSAADRDAFKYLGFEDRFRGPRDEIRKRLESYVPLFAGATNVLDAGCGRGELLELFRDAGIGAQGIDTNERMVSVCTERGLRAAQADALAFVRAQPDASLGGLIAIQVVEHLSPDYLMAFLEAAFHALRPGAILVLETINAACWMAFFETYLRDLTHARPLHPDTLKFLAEASGFTQVEISFRVPVRDEDRLPRVDPAHIADANVRALATALNAHADQLNARLFSSMDYALIARR
jgi:O-antigen chain-terminating methyltransferase